MYFRSTLAQACSTRSLAFWRRVEGWDRGRKLWRKHSVPQDIQTTCPDGRTRTLHAGLYWSGTKSVLGLESKLDVLIMRRSAVSLGAPGLPGPGPAQRMRRTMLACACNTPTPLPAPKCTRQRVPECVYTLKCHCMGCLPASPALVSLPRARLTRPGAAGGV